METANEIITQARLRSNLTRAELSRRTDITRAALLEYEKGTRTPRFDTLVRLLDATGAEITITMPPRPVQQIQQIHRDNRAEAIVSPSLSATAALLDDDNAANWRLLISDFVANEFVPASKEERAAMLKAEPMAGALRWHLFVNALAEHLSFHAELPPPRWLAASEPSLPAFWWPVHGELPSQRASAMAWSPASFRRRGILIDGRELPIVAR